MAFFQCIKIKKESKMGLEGALLIELNYSPYFSNMHRKDKNGEVKKYKFENWWVDSFFYFFIIAKNRDSVR